MTLKIVKGFENQQAVFRLSGRIRSVDLAEIKELMAGTNERMFLDLKDVTIVDREVVAFLRECEANGIAFMNCPAYIREWISRDGNSSKKGLSE
jgi:hypothetical protein